MRLLLPPAADLRCSANLFISQCTCNVPHGGGLAPSLDATIIPVPHTMQLRESLPDANATGGLSLDGTMGNFGKTMRCAGHT